MFIFLIAHVPRMRVALTGNFGKQTEELSFLFKAASPSVVRVILIVILG